MHILSIDTYIFPLRMNTDVTYVITLIFIIRLHLFSVWHCTYFHCVVVVGFMQKQVMKTCVQN